MSVTHYNETRRALMEFYSKLYSFFCTPTFQSFLFLMENCDISTTYND